MSTTNGDKPPEPRRPERRGSLGRAGCGLCDGTGWTEQHRASGVIYAVPCRCRPDYDQACRRINELADAGIIDVKPRPSVVPGTRELSEEQKRGLLAEARDILRRDI